MLCLYCHKEANQRHHIIFRNKTQCGTDNEINIANLCFDCHYQIHHGTNTELKKKIMKVCYDKIKDNLDDCWKGKIKPKIIRILENQ